MLFLCFFSYSLAPIKPDAFISKGYMGQVDVPRSRARANSWEFDDWRRQFKCLKNNSPNVNKHWKRSNRTGICGDLPPPQPRANTWDGTYPIDRSTRVLRRRVYYIEVNLESLYVYARQLRYRLMHLEIDLPQKVRFEYIESKQTTANNVIIGYPTPQPKTFSITSHSHEDLSMWDELFVYDTYDLVARIKKQVRRIRETLKHAWAFMGLL